MTHVMAADIPEQRMNTNMSEFNGSVEYTFSERNIEILKTFKDEYDVEPDLDLVRKMTVPWYKWGMFDKVRVVEYGQTFPHVRIMTSDTTGVVWTRDNWYVNSLLEVLSMLRFGRKITLSVDQCNALRYIGIPEGDKL